VNPVESRISLPAPREECTSSSLTLRTAFPGWTIFLKDFRLTRVNTVGVGAGAASSSTRPVFPQRAEFQIVEMDPPRLIVSAGRIAAWAARRLDRVGVQRTSTAQPS